MWILFFIGVGVMVVVLVSVMAYVAINQPEEEDGEDINATPSTDTAKGENPGIAGKNKIGAAA